MNCTQNSTETTTDSNGLQFALIWTMALMSAIACCSNLLVIATIFGTKSLRTISSVFLLNLSFCDFFIGLVVMPIIANNVKYNRWTLSQDACISIGLWNHLLQAASINTVTFIALDRYFTIIHCLKYSSWSKYRYICIVMFWIWIISLAMTLPTMSENYGYMEYDSTRYMCIPNWNNRKGIVMISSVGLYIFPIIIMTYCYFKIIGVARNHARKISDMTNQINKNMTNRENDRSGMFGAEMLESVNRISMITFPAVNHRHRGVVKIPHRISDRSLSRFEREARAAIRLVGLILSFIGCWTLYIIVNCALSYGNFSDIFPQWTLPLSLWLSIFHCTFNPFLYAIMSKRFRFAVRRMFSKCLHIMTGTVEVVKVSELRSKCYDTDNGIRTISYAPTRRCNRMNTISERKVFTGNRIILSPVQKHDANIPGTPLNVVEITHRTCNNEIPDNIVNPSHQNVYHLSVPKKSFKNGKGSILIETVKSDNTRGETVETSIHVRDCSDPEENKSDTRSDNNTKIRIQLDLT